MLNSMTGYHHQYDSLDFGVPNYITVRVLFLFVCFFFRLITCTEVLHNVHNYFIFCWVTRYGEYTQAVDAKKKNKGRINHL